ncbi:hypothetical protein [Bacillus taeanensis]|uniref:hypothetical protein n=1 Tax=Bacillus taeanensis TaxID=273032 RepID=UPI0015F09EC0|nr:hypothetical protein [Bacillus taeanensis]
MDKFHLADLNEEEHARLKALENELGIVLIAWEDGEVKQHTYDNYYDLVEDDRL